LDDEAGWHHFTVVGDRFLAAWDREGSDCLLVGGILGGDAEQLLRGVPDDVI
jgi:hypothetical protein